MKIARLGLHLASAAVLLALPAVVQAQFAYMITNGTSDHRGFEGVGGRAG